MIGFPDFLSLNLNFQNQELCNNYAKGTANGIRPLWRVLFLSSILSSFQMIILPFSYADKRGWDSAHPAFSCKEILDSGHSKGDGEYWIDPEKSGNPLKVYCDMSRSGGKRMNCFFETRGLQQEYIRLGTVVIGTLWSWLFLLSLPRSLLCFESKLQQNSRKWLVIISRPIWSLTGQCTRHICNWTV